MTTETTFADLGLEPALLEALEDLGFENPTPVQAAAIPPLLAGRDIVGRARTGSGKTAAFGLPTLQRITRDKNVRALILAPTRELAQQVNLAMRSFSPSTHTFAIYGGTSYDPQLRALRRGTSVVVGTPGRILDLLDRGALDLSKLEVLVLDEGDQMLQLGFLEDVERIIEASNPDRQLALFSATMPDDIRRIADKHQTDSVEVSIGGEGPVIDHIEQMWMRVPHRHKFDALVRVLEGQPGVPTLVFARTRRSCAEIADGLAKKGIGADALHGDLNQAARERVLARLRAGRLNVLIATDVAARGLDVDGLELVINLDLPEGPDAYVHRIGRTGRAGRAGKAINFVAPSQRRFVRDVRRRFDIQMAELPIPSDADVARQQRRGLEKRLEDVRDDAPSDVIAAVDRLLTTGEWTADEIAVAALTLLADASGIDLGDLPDDAPPHWSVHPRDRPDRGGQARGPHNRGSDPTNEARLFIAAGYRHGVRPGDIVGAIANETGLPGSSIGKIDIFDGKTYVGLSNQDIAHVLDATRTLDIRGRKAKLDRVRERN